MSRFKSSLFSAEPKITFKHVEDMTPEVERILEESTRDRFLGDIVRSKNVRHLIMFYYDNKAAGFAIPRKDSDGYHRTGPIFVLPQYRRKGIAHAFVAEFFKDKKGRAYIETDNTASRALFKGVGFEPSGKTLKDGDDTLEEYLKN